MEAQSSVKEDCFAYMKIKHSCACLTELVCESGKCSFYKTLNEAKESRARAEHNVRPSQIDKEARGKYRISRY